MELYVKNVRTLLCLKKCYVKCKNTHNQEKKDNLVNLFKLFLCNFKLLDMNEWKYIKDYKGVSGVSVKVLII